MGERAEKQVLTAVAGVGALFLLGVAIAAPQGRPVQPRVPSQIQPLGQHLAFGQHLDLRAPAPAANVAEKSAAFPSGSHRHSLGSAVQAQPPGLGTDNMRSRPAIQDFVRRVHHEGLPLARLFESKSALVHLGLSPKGKPGLWLVQKIQ
jgi:hypothetical protein